MPQVLTDILIRAAKPPIRGRRELADLREPGLTFRITDKGKRTWSFRFRKPGLAGEAAGFARVTLGTYPEIGLQEARKAAASMRRQVEGGELPRSPRYGRKGGGDTLEAIAARYLTEYAERHKRSHSADARNLRLHVLPAVTGNNQRPWCERSMAAIKRADVIELLEDIVSAGKPTLANRVQSLISGVYSFAIDAAVTETNPCHRLRRRGTETVSTRVLSNSELNLFWRGIIQPEAARRSGLALRLALLTGVRVGEAAGICRAELQHIGEPSKALWIIPGARTKNGLDHAIPLSPLAHASVLDLLDMLPPGEQYLLPTRARDRTGPVRGNTLTQAMDHFSRRLAGGDLAMTTWTADPPTPHDLRRTVETRMAGLRVPKEIRDRCLNHIPRDVGSRHYDQHSYLDEKREAFGRWSAALAAILDPGTGVSIADARAGK